jgi:hypothetical protein
VFENPPEGTDYEHLPTAYATVKLDFRQNAADCPPPRRFDVRLEAESSAAAAFYEWAAGLCGGSDPFALDVTNTSSTAARHQFFEKHVDVGVSSVPPQAGEVTTTSPPFLVAPVDLTAVVVAYVIVDPVTGQQITDLTLSPRLVARLISDTDVLTLFTDPEFQKLNPGHTFPQQTAEPGLRAEQNGDSWIVTKWLNSDPARGSSSTARIPTASRSTLRKGIDYPTDVLEARPTGSYLPRTGEETARSGSSTRRSRRTACRRTPRMPASPSSTSRLRAASLPIAKLTAGVGAGRHTEPGERRSRVQGDDDDARRIPCGRRDPAIRRHGCSQVDHGAGLPLRRAPIRAPASIARLLRYAAGPGQQRLPDGFVPMPAGLAAQTTQVAAACSRRPTTTTTTPASAAVLGRRSGSCGVPTNRRPRRLRPARSTTRRRVAVVAVKAAENAERRPNGAGVRGLLSGPERFALPVVLLVGLLALALGAADLTRRKLAGPGERPRGGARAGRGRGGRGLAVVADPGVPQTAPAARVGIVSTVARRGVYTLGIAIAVFVAFAFWFSGLAHARAQVGLDRRFRAELTGASAPIGGRIAPGAPVAIVRIPRIGVDEVVVEGSTSGELRKGPGHVVGSSLPGQPGNAAIAGRRTLYGGRSAVSGRCTRRRGGGHDRTGSRDLPRRKRGKGPGR